MESWEKLRRQIEGGIMATEAWSPYNGELVEMQPGEACDATATKKPEVRRTLRNPSRTLGKKIIKPGRQKHFTRPNNTTQNVRH
jgi:hypothetical protein